MASKSRPPAKRPYLELAARSKSWSHLNTRWICTLTLRALSFSLLWWILAEGRQDGWLLGLLAVAAATWASMKLLPPMPLTLNPVGLLAFLVFFIRYSIQGGFQVAGMALRGRIALQPALLDLEIGLPPGAARTLLVNSLSLMPGTLTVEVDSTHLRLHVLDERLPVTSEVRALESAINRLFGQHL